MSYKHLINFVERMMVKEFLRREFHHEVVAKGCLKFAIRFNSKLEREAINNALNTRKVHKVFHFTHISNVRNIADLGLIPRKYLELPVVAKSIQPFFSDPLRLDQREHLNSLSVSYPNYKMFYSKTRISGQDDWVLCEFAAHIMADYFSEFCITNLASGAQVESGAKGFESIFGQEPVRAKLRLPDCYPTDPQSELLIGSFVDARHVSIYHVRAQSALRKLESLGLNAKITPELFGPRYDWEYWRKKSILNIGQTRV